MVDNFGLRYAIFHPVLLFSTKILWAESPLYFCSFPKFCLCKRALKVAADLAGAFIDVAVLMTS